MLSKLKEIISSDNQVVCVGRKVVCFGGIDISSLPLPPNVTLHPEVAEYLATCIPDDYVRIDLNEPYCRRSSEGQRVVAGYGGSYELCPREEFIMLNVPAIPMEWMPPHGYGFIRIANDNGDALAFDAGTAELFRFDHDISYFQDKIVVIEGPNLRKEFPMNCEGLRSASTHRYASFSDFCRKILEAATIARTNTAPPPPVQ